ncbi:MAG: cell wall-binding repeat-containing protein [Actinomycetota bacterium]|nr:cell wall-binding repeat-containing protein [Actinomycetota bacterium]
MRRQGIRRWGALAAFAVLLLAGSGVVQASFSVASASGLQPGSARALHSPRGGEPSPRAGDRGPAPGRMGADFALQHVGRVLPLRSVEHPLPGRGPDLPAWSTGPRAPAGRGTPGSAPGGPAGGRGEKDAGAIAHGAPTASLNWAGQIDTASGQAGAGAGTGTVFSAVAGSWHVPSVTPSAGPENVSTWVGIGGVGTTRLIQTGTTVTVSGGTVRYFAWVELLPTAPVYVDAVVHPGDAMQAFIEERASGVWTIEIEDVTQGWRAETTTVRYTAGTQTTAEWITERPLTVSSGTFTTLADFGSTQFTHLLVTGTNLTAASLSSVYMTNTATVVIAYPSAPTSSTTGNFTDYYGTPLPTVTSLTPSQGSSSGGTSVTIQGTYLVPTLLEAVDFGTYPATVTSSSSGAITVTTPAEPPGVVDVTVTTTDGTSAPSNASTFLVVGPGTTRIFGATADATAAAELEHQFPAATGQCPGTTGTRPVVLATDAAYPDALASAYLARDLGTGTLLTPPASLSPAALGAIAEEGITRVVVVGGPLAVTTAVVDRLQSTPADTCGGAATLPGPVDIEVTRVAGATQYGTAAKIAETVPATQVGEASFPGAYAGTNGSGGEGRYNDTAGVASAAPSSPTALPTAIVATGRGLEDAQAASAMAYAQRFPILLTTSAALSSEVTSAIDTLGIRQVIVVGGPLAVSSDVVTSLEGLGVSVLRIAGQTCSGTSVELARFETAGAGDGLGWTGTGALTVARGNGFTDGLAGAVVAADGPSAAAPEPLVLTVGPTSVGTALAAFLRTAGTTGIGGVRVTRFTILGGPLAITQTTANAMGSDL